MRNDSMAAVRSCWNELVDRVKSAFVCSDTTTVPPTAILFHGCCLNAQDQRESRPWMLYDSAAEISQLPTARAFLRVRPSYAMKNGGLPWQLRLQARTAQCTLVCVRAVCYATQPEWENDKSTRIHFRHRFNCVAPRILRKINLMLPGIQVETAAIICENHSTASRLLYVHIQKLKLSMISIPSSLNDTPFNRDRYHFDSFNLWLWWPIKRIIVTTQIHGHLFIMVLANGEFRWEYWRNSMITFFYNVTRKQIPIKYYIYLFQ